MNLPSTDLTDAGGGSVASGAGPPGDRLGAPNRHAIALGAESVTDLRTILITGGTPARAAVDRNPAPVPRPRPPAEWPAPPEPADHAAYADWRTETLGLIRPRVG